LDWKDYIIYVYSAILYLFIHVVLTMYDTKANTKSDTVVNAYITHVHTSN